MISYVVSPPETEELHTGSLFPCQKLHGPDISSAILHLKVKRDAMPPSGTGVSFFWRSSLFPVPRLCIPYHVETGRCSGQRRGTMTKDSIYSELADVVAKEWVGMIR
jgi:hypothetical protein